MNFEIEELTELEEMRELVQLFLDIWERSTEPPLNSDVLRALSHAGNYIAGSRSEGRLIGGIVGWLGMHPRGELLLHSHILGVLPTSEARGLGFALKQHQRGWCLERGVHTMEWTFDPLIRRNAYFNLNKLGAGAAEYLVDFYGPMNDGINTRDQSDRILVRWHLDAPTAADVDAAGARAMLRIGDGGEPLIEPAAPPATCTVPDEIVEIRHTRPDLARRWREALRGTLGAHLIAGGRLEGVTRDGVYVLG
jgi:predicted GNAT superfamily acetyltransferase